MGKLTTAAAISNAAGISVYFDGKFQGADLETLVKFADNIANFKLTITQKVIDKVASSSDLDDEDKATFAADFAAPGLYTWNRKSVKNTADYVGILMGLGVKAQVFVEGGK